MEEQNEPTEELDMLCNMMQNIKDRYKAFKKSVRFDGQIIEISGKEYADMVMKYALMLPEYNVKKAEKELQDFKDNKINLLTNKEARKNKVEKVARHWKNLALNFRSRMRKRESTITGRWFLMKSAENYLSASVRIMD